MIGFMIMCLTAYLCVRLMISGLRDMLGSGRSSETNAEVNVHIENSFNGGNTYDSSSTYTAETSGATDDFTFNRTDHR